MAGLDDLCRSFLDLWYHFDPAAATRAGAPDQDGRLGSFDPDSLRLHVAALRSIAGAVEDLDIDDTESEIDRTALLEHLRVLLFRFEHEHPFVSNPALWILHAADAFDGLLVRPPDESGAVHLLARIRALPAFLLTARTTLRRPPVLLVDLALAELDGLGTLLDHADARFAAEWEADGALALSEAKAALEQFRDALINGIPHDSTPHGAAIGEDEVDRRVHHEHASTANGAELYRRALRQAVEVEAEVAAAAAAIDPGATWQQVYQRIRAGAAAPEKLLPAYAAALLAARQFAELHGLTGAGEIPLQVVEAPAYQRLLDAGAFYRGAGADTPAAVVVTGGEPLEVLWLATRLGVPGLHLHFLERARLPGPVRRSIAAASLPLGWELYASDLMREAGYAREPALRLAERVLFLRDAHAAVADIGLHLRQMTAGEAIGHLTSRLPMDRKTAEILVRRMACYPLEAAAAMLGRSELHRLREDVRAIRGADFSLADFHADVFAYGGLPVPLIRWGLGLDG